MQSTSWPLAGWHPRVKDKGCKRALAQREAKAQSTAEIEQVADADKAQPESVPSWQRLPICSYELHVKEWLIHYPSAPAFGGVSALASDRHARMMCFKHIACQVLICSGENQQRLYTESLGGNKLATCIYRHIIA